MDIGKEILKIQYRIPDNLSRAVVGDIAAAVNLIKCSAFGLELFLRQKQIVEIAAFP